MAPGSQWPFYRRAVKKVDCSGTEKKRKNESKKRGQQGLLEIQAGFTQGEDVVREPAYRKNEVLSK